MTYSPASAPLRIMLPIYLASLLHIFPTYAQLTPSPTYDPPPASSATSASLSPDTQWANVLGNALWFYDAQRSGHLDQGSYPNRVAWRNDSALQDGSDWNLDLSGGWYDAGDVGRSRLSSCRYTLADRPPAVYQSHVPSRLHTVCSVLGRLDAWKGL